MAKNRQMNILFPMGGENRRVGYAQQNPPYTTMRSRNVVSIEPLEQRARGGSRPGIVKAVTGSLGGPVLALQRVKYGGATKVIAIADSALFVIG